MEKRERGGKMEQFCDLHTHSYYSDGSCSPAELVNMAEALGLGAVALTDHNTVNGLPEFLEAARGRKVEAVAGVEFSVDYADVELHLLGLWIPQEHFPDVSELLEDGKRRKEQSNRELVERLNQAGFRLDYPAIRERTPAGQVNRAHIAVELTRMGYTSSVQEAFQKLLRPECGYYIPPKRPDVFQTIRFLKQIGAVTVLAHPFLNLPDTEVLWSFLKRAADCGLDGMETHYPLFDAEMTRIARALAREFHLKESGGSDFHGIPKPDIQMGTGKGSLRVPMELARKLKPEIL